MTFPQTPVDLRIEIDAGGTWTDISSDVYARDQVKMTRGRPDEASATNPGSCTFTQNNRSGKYSPRNPNSPYFGLIGRNTQMRVSVPAPSSYAQLPGPLDETYSVATPDNAAIDITGDIDIRLDVSLENWNILTTDVLELAGKYTTTGNQRSWYLSINGFSGGLRLAWSPDGTSAAGIHVDGAVPVPVPASGRVAVRATLDVNNGLGGYTVTFYTSDTISGTWTQLEQVVTTGGTTSLFNSTAPLEIGNITSILYATAAHQPAYGKLYAFELRNGIGGTVKANPVFTNKAAGTTSFTDASGRAWTLSGGVTVTDRNFRFFGEVSSWPTRWDTGGFDRWVPIEAGGILRRLGQGQKALDSSLRRRVPSYSPLAYWPMEDGSDSTRATSPIAGVQSLRTTGFSFAQLDTLASSNPLPVIDNTKGTPTLRGNIPAPSGAITGWHVRWVYRLDTINTTLRTFMRVRSTGTVTDWTVQSRNNLTNVTGIAADGTTVFSDNYATGIDLYNQWNEFRLSTSQSGGTVTYTVTWQDVGGDYGAASGSFTGTIGHPTAIVSPDGGYHADLNGMSLGHISAFGTTTSNAYLGAVTAYAGEYAAQRMTRLSSEESVPVSVFGTFPNEEQIGTQRPLTLLNLVQDAADADGGILYERRDSTALGYRDRNTLVNQNPALTIAYSNHALIGPLEPTDDDYLVRNDVTVTRTNGSSAREVDTTSRLSTLSPPLGAGVYNTAVTYNMYDDSRLDFIAGWLLHLGTWDGERYPVVRLALHNDPTLIDAATAVDSGDRIQITGPPSWLPAGTIDLMVLGYTETVNQFEWYIDYTCVPYGPWLVASADDTVYGRADTEGAQLSAGATSSATTLSVATTSGPLWTADPDDVPFDVSVSGEVVTVTAVGQVLNANPRFEINTTDWTPTSATLTRSNVQAKNGTWSGLLTTTAGSNPRADSGSVAVTVGSSYRASGWLFPPAALATGAGVNVNWFDAAHTYLSTSSNTTVPTVGVWQLYDAVFTAPATSAFATVVFTVAGTPGAGLLLYGDDIKIVPVTSYATSPQTFTVSRSTNGVVKTQSSGADVRLANPAIVAL
jgi:hypothetical protein